MNRKNRSPSSFESEHLESPEILKPDSSDSGRDMSRRTFLKGAVAGAAMVVGDLSRKGSGLFPDTAEAAPLGGRPERLEFQKLIEREKASLRTFFGYEIAVPPLPDEITPERYEKWKKIAFELHYLPAEKMGKGRQLPGWKKKPPNSFYVRIQNGELHPNSIVLPGAWALVDTREKPQSQDGKQMYQDDVLAKVLENLRQKKVIPEFKVQGSRFGISWHELHNPEVKKAIAEALDVSEEFLRLPYAIEWNYLGNAYYSKWGGTDTAEWFEDIYEYPRPKGEKRLLDEDRLFGGNSSGGGLSSVALDLPLQRDDQVGFRPLVVLLESRM